MFSRHALKLSRSLRASQLARAPLVLSRLSAPLRVPVAGRAISSSVPRFEISALSTKLAEEIKYEETDAAEVEEEPDFLKDFKAEGVWEIVDAPGADEVILTRTFGNEQFVPPPIPFPPRLTLSHPTSIRLIFSISDLDADLTDPADLSPFNNANEESADAGSGGVGDEVVEDAEEGEGMDDSFPVEAVIIITKEGVKGALSIDATAQDGLFTINNVCYYADEGLASGQSAEDEWKRSGLYMGPDFDNLDENVQMEFETYLDERGINSNLALFVPDLCEHKEQKEYLSWLKNVKSFIEA